MKDTITKMHFDKCKEFVKEHKKVLNVKNDDSSITSRAFEIFSVCLIKDDKNFETASECVITEKEEKIDAYIIDEEDENDNKHSTNEKEIIFIQSKTSTTISTDDISAFLNFINSHFVREEQFPVKVNDKLNKAKEQVTKYHNNRQSFRIKAYFCTLGNLKTQNSDQTKRINALINTFNQSNIHLEIWDEERINEETISVFSATEYSRNIPFECKLGNDGSTGQNVLIGRNNSYYVIRTPISDIVELI
jgi:hypothetical protein